MSEKKGWGSTVLGWFVVQDDQGSPGAPDVPAEESPGGPEAPALPPGQDFFQKTPPAPTGGVVDFDAVFDAAGIADEEQARVGKAIALLRGLPAETPVAVRKQIVEASLTAFGVPIDKIIETGVAEIQALEGYIRVGASDTQSLLGESERRIRQYEDEIRQIRTVMEQRVQEQTVVTRACNEQKLAVQQILEFFGRDAVERVVHASPKLRAPADAAE